MNASRVNIDSLPRFLEVYPWDSQLLNGISPMNYLWSFDLNVPVDRLWDQLIDTSSLNQRMGLPRMQYQERDGKLYGKTKNAGILMEWEEVPWEWEYCKSLSNARIYSKGMAFYVRSRFLFYSIGVNNTKLLVYFGWIPRNILGRFILSIGMRKIQKDYNKALNEIVSEIKGSPRDPSQNSAIVDSHYSSYFIKDKVDKSAIPVYESKVREIGKKLILDGVDPGLVDRFLYEISFGDENELYRIQIKKYADDWNVNQQDLLKLALFACKYGLLTLSWDLVCPHCRGVRSELKNLGEIPSEGNCDVCDIDFSTSGKNSIEVTFHVHPSIRKIEKRFFCAAEPATKKHIYLQKWIDPNRVYETNIQLQSGIYRLRAGNDKSYSLLEIDSTQGLSTSLEWDSSGISNEDIKKSSGNLELRLVNSHDLTIPFVIETRKEDQYALRPGDLLNFKEFKNIFSEEYIGLGITLDIGVQTILFTDIVGSTALYVKHGDSKAFSEVRKHFVELYRLIEDNNGVVVKTIGDSVMASFSDPGDSVLAGIDIQEFFQNPNASDLLRVRISIHSGTCLAVNFNNGIDYFGNTVNYASKLQRFAEAGDIVLSSDMLDLKEVKKILKNNQDTYKVKRFRFKNKWTGSSEETAYKISIGY